MKPTSILKFAENSGANIRLSHCHLFHVIEAPSYFALVSLDEAHDYLHRGRYSKNELKNRITNFRNKLITLEFQALPELPLEIEPTFTTLPLYFHTLGDKLKGHFNREFTKYRLQNQIAFA